MENGHQSAVFVIQTRIEIDVDPHKTHTGGLQRLRRFFAQMATQSDIQHKTHLFSLVKGGNSPYNTPLSRPQQEPALETFHAFILALVQGVTEFLPISSSAHLILVPEFLGWPDQGVAFDAFISLGTLAAVIAYFHRDLAAIVYYWFGQFRSARAPDPGQYARLGNLLIVATIPAVIAGFFLSDYVDDYLRHPLLIAGTTLVFGLLLGAADYFGRKTLALPQTGWRAALFYGLAQMLSLIPGVSRSGITMTAGLMMGFSREAAARFSFLMSIPITVAAGTLETVKMLRADAPLNWMALGTGFAVSAVAGYLCIKYFLHFLNRYGMWPHVIYRIGLSAVLLAVFL